jgi:uncharacterized protein YjbI with pentapeptide repeats
MLNRSAASRPGIRSLVGGIVAVLLAVALTWVLFVPAADWLAHHDVGSAQGPLMQAARDAARGRLLTLGAGLLAAGALLFTARNFTLSREGQVTDRYTKAIEQLGSDKLDVRIGGIYALERIARDSARDHPTVMEVLTAFIRAHSRDRWPLPGPDDAEPEPSTRPDVQAALTVIGRRDAKSDIRTIDLAGADLVNAQIDGNLSGAHLADGNLTKALLLADLSGANLHHANLTGARLTAKLADANLTGADLTGVTFIFALLTSADLNDATLVGADLTGADLTSAVLQDANLTRACLHLANLGDADLTGANLEGAIFSQTNLTGAKWPANAAVPRGWELDPGCGRLKGAVD